VDTIGWFGSIMFAVCGLPQAIQCAKDGHSNGLNWFFLIAWVLGEICTIIYVIPKSDWILLSNYFVNLVFLGIMLRYKIYPRVNENVESELIINYTPRML